MPKIEMLFGEEAVEKDAARRARDCIKRALAKAHPTAKVSIRFKPFVTVVTISDAKTRDYMRLRDEVLPKVSKQCKL